MMQTLTPRDELGQKLGFRQDEQTRVWWAYNCTIDRSALTVVTRMTGWINAIGTDLAMTS